jgi:hypothetical protein
MRSCGVIALAVALFLAGLALYSLLGVTSDCSANFRFGSSPLIGHNALACIAHLFFVFGKVNFPSHFQKKNSLAQKAEGANSLKLSLFRGREAKLNRAILLTLFQDGPLVVYDITKEIRKRREFRKTKYTNVNRRVRALLEQGYLETVGSREIQSGSRGALYQPTIRANVAFYLSRTSRDQFVKEANDDALTTELAALALFLGKDRS